MRTNRIKIRLYRRIMEPQHRTSHGAELFIPFVIRKHMFFFGVPDSVEFYHKIAHGNIKIHNIISERFLAIDRNGKIFQKSIPKFLFFLGHVFT